MISTESETFSVWDYNHGSGEGSDPDFSRSYIDFVSKFIKEHDIKSVIDLGCGDFRIGSSIDYGAARVIAVDASADHIKNHQEKFKRDGLEFQHYDLRKVDMSAVDLVLIKDVIQHWPTEDIVQWLKKTRPRFMLCTNDTEGGAVNGNISYPSANRKKLEVNVRGLNLNTEPFNVGGTVVLNFNKKSTILLERGQESNNGQVPSQE